METRHFHARQMGFKSILRVRGGVGKVARTKREEVMVQIPWVGQQSGCTAAFGAQVFVCSTRPIPVPVLVPVPVSNIGKCTRLSAATTGTGGGGVWGCKEEAIAPPPSLPPCHPRK